MTARNGSLLAFAQYLQQTRRPREKPVIWRAQDISSAVSAMPVGDRGSVALSHGRPGEVGVAAPGLSLTIQSLPAGTRLAPHRHSFWHLYTVMSGAGAILLDDDATPLRLARNDWIFVPAWCQHALDNSGGRVPLTLAALQNLPQNAAIGSLLRQEKDQEPQVIYAGDAL